jgi:hypothetical protein
MRPRIPNGTPADRKYDGKEHHPTNWDEPIIDLLGSLWNFHFILVADVYKSILSAQFVYDTGE